MLSLNSTNTIATVVTMVISVAATRNPTTIRPSISREERFLLNPCWGTAKL